MPSGLYLFLEGRSCHLCFFVELYINLDYGDKSAKVDAYIPHESGRTSRSVGGKRT